MVEMEVVRRRSVGTKEEERVGGMRGREGEDELRFIASCPAIVDGKVGKDLAGMGCYD
jgi:hypothetical protein